MAVLCRLNLASVGPFLGGEGEGERGAEKCGWRAYWLAGWPGEGCGVWMLDIIPLSCAKLPPPPNLGRRQHRPECHDCHNTCHEERLTPHSEKCVAASGPPLLPDFPVRHRRRSVMVMALHFSKCNLNTKFLKTTVAMCILCINLEKLKGCIWIARERL